MVPKFRDQDRYDILDEHGRGGLGRVSRAHDRELGRDIAIKELISRGTLGEVRFLREALITARLEHPGIVPVYEAGRWPDGTPFYAMKLVSGRPLRDLIAARKTVDERLALLHHVIAVADAMAYAHGRNIIHRDLKPANVIVGDFGETVVIDWGLAKDLTANEESSVAGEPCREHRDDDLTSAGAVLGTPSYMAPEQARGEPVDQRADVFAIGAMLWELCALHKLPPGFSGQRRRILRKAGIDPDLVTIAEKALAPDPDRRYRDAGALAADLKAFKAGARIAARRYSPWALLAHWIRRHLAPAAMAVGALAVALAGAVLHVRDVTAERDRADSSEERARRAQADAEASLDELTLKHAQLLLTTDPSASRDLLASYRGRDVVRADQIRAEAVGRGTAFVRATPHTAMVRWMDSTPDGAIVSLSTDGTIVRTSPEGTSAVLLRDVARFAQLSYSRARRLLAYACDPSDLCLYDVLHSSRVPTAAIFHGVHPAGISFSPDGSALAVMSRDATLRVVDVRDPTHPRLRLAKHVPGGSDTVYFRNDVVVGSTPDTLEFVAMDGRSERFTVPDNSLWDANPEGSKFAVANVQGLAFLFEGPPMRLVSQIELCQGPVVGLQFIPHTQTLAFGCREGRIGIWNPQRGIVSPRGRVEGYADLVSVSPTGEYIVAAGGNGTVTLFDLTTGLATFYKGHESRVTAITPPSPGQPFVLSADVRGALRAWPVPARNVRVAVALNSQFNTGAFDKHSNTVIATSYLPTLTTFSPASGGRSFGPHEPRSFSLVQSATGNTFATYGLSELVEFWSATTMTRTSVINTRQGSLTHLSFVDDTDDVVTAGRDGRLVRWTPSGAEATLARLDQPIDVFALLPADATHTQGSVVFSSFDGTLWHTTASGQPAKIRHGDARASRLLALPDHRTVLAGTARGKVVAIDTLSWKYRTVLQATAAVRNMLVTPDGRWLVIGTNDGVIHVGTMNDGTIQPTTTTWQKLSIRARHEVVTSDGVLVAVCSDGTIWLFSISTHHWVCLPIAHADFRWVTTSVDDTTAAALDIEGRLIWIDLAAAREVLSGTQQTPRMDKQHEEDHQAP